MKHYVRGWGRVPIVPRPPLTEDEREQIAHGTARELARLRERQALMGVACGDQFQHTGGGAAPKAHGDWNVTSAVDNAGRGVGAAGMQMGSDDNNAQGGK